MKTGALLRHVERPLCYVPVDISGEHLRAAAERVASQFPDIEVCPLHADFGGEFALPQVQTAIARRVAYFPGSTIGNFRPDAARQLLTRIAHLMGPGGGLLIGFDLEKNHETLELAYDDSQAVTAAFNKNLLRRINRELDGDFELEKFDHQAIYNATHHRIEMHLVSSTDQTVSIGDEPIRFAAGESIRTELSHKYQIEAFSDLAAQSGFANGTVWTDPASMFAVGYYPVAN